MDNEEPVYYSCSHIYVISSYPFHFIVTLVFCSLLVQFIVIYVYDQNNIQLKLVWYKKVVSQYESMKSLIYKYPIWKQEMGEPIIINICLVWQLYKKEIVFNQLYYIAFNIEHLILKIVQSKNLYKCSCEIIHHETTITTIFTAHFWAYHHLILPCT